MSNSSKQIPTLNLLVAYPYFSSALFSRITALTYPSCVLVDSGAYTAWNTGKEVTLDGYCAALDALPFKPWRYFALDVVNQPVATRANLDEMRRRGYQPSPVLTPAESVDEVERLFDCSDFIGVATYKPRRYQADQQVRLVNVLKAVNGRKAHLLGLTSMNWVKLHRPYSIDSSTWLNARKYGSMRLYVGRGRTRQITRASLQRGMDDEVRLSIASLGLDPYALRHRESWEYAKGRGTGLVSHINAASWALTAIDMERGIGTKTFFVVADSVIESLLEGWETALRSRGLI